MTHISTDLQPIPVTVTNAGALAGMAASKHRKYIRSVYRTFVLPGGTALPILAEDLSRGETYLIAYGNCVVICESQSQAQDPDNQAAGTGQFLYTPLNPQGTLLYAYAGGSPGVMASARWPLLTTEVVWATSIESALLAITTTNYAEGY